MTTQDEPRKRIHVIILTKDRPEELHRCIETVLSSFGPDDMLTILDDSLSPFPLKSSALAASKVERDTLLHLSVARARDALVRLLPRAHSVWLSKTAPRDIAPQRNIALLLSIIVAAETTVLVDDDIVGFNLLRTHEHLAEYARSSPGIIAGADIAGISELEIITRFAGAITAIEKLPADTEIDSVCELFRAESCPASPAGSSARYVSGGYLAFRIPTDRRFAFPPGYNEDWLWCILHGRDDRVRVLRLGESVIHAPPSIRCSTREDALFELQGDIVFDCLEEHSRGKNLDPESALLRLSGEIPDGESMPFVRTSELLARARSLKKNHHLCNKIEECGLAVLADMLRQGELEMDGGRVLADWCFDAVAKHRSFAAALHDQTTTLTLKNMLYEGKL